MTCPTCLLFYMLSCLTCLVPRVFVSQMPRALSRRSYLTGSRALRISCPKFYCALSTSCPTYFCAPCSSCSTFHHRLLTSYFTCSTVNTMVSNLSKTNVITVGFFISNINLQHLLIYVTSLH